MFVSSTSTDTNNSNTRSATFALCTKRPSYEPSTFKLSCEKFNRLAIGALLRWCRESMRRHVNAIGVFWPLPAA